jgi:hypothetical protein
MAARTATAAGRRGAGGRDVSAGSTGLVLSLALRPRVVVIAPTVVGAVLAAGGWLFDSVMAGRRASVHTVDRADDRVLRILGADAAAPVSQIAAQEPDAALCAVAVEAALYRADPCVHRFVDAGIRAGVDVWLWGEPAEGALDVSGMVQHRLSLAAKAFKAQALSAVAGLGSPGGGESPEWFWSTGPSAIGEDATR